MITLFRTEHVHKCMTELYLSRSIETRRSICVVSSQKVLSSCRWYWHFRFCIFFCRSCWLLVSIITWWNDLHLKCFLHVSLHACRSRQIIYAEYIWMFREFIQSDHVTIHKATAEDVISSTSKCDMMIVSWMWNYIVDV